MAQGKTKVKSKLPDGVKQKKSTGKNHYTRKKGLYLNLNSIESIKISTNKFF